MEKFAPLSLPCASDDGGGFMRLIAVSADFLTISSLLNLLQPLFVTQKYFRVGCSF